MLDERVIVHEVAPAAQQEPVEVGLTAGGREADAHLVAGERAAVGEAVAGEPGVSAQLGLGDGHVVSLGAELLPHHVLHLRAVAHSKPRNVRRKRGDLGLARDMHLENAGRRAGRHHVVEPAVMLGRIGPRHVQADDEGLVRAQPARGARPEVHSDVRRREGGVEQLERVIARSR